MHENIGKYTLDGVVADSGNLLEHKERLIHFVETQMRDSGSVPILDIEPQYTQTYRPQWENYYFELTIYCTYIGEDEAWATAGVMSGKKIMKHSQKIK